MSIAKTHDFVFWLVWQGAFSKAISVNRIVDERFVTTLCPEKTRRDLASGELLSERGFYPPRVLKPGGLRLYLLLILVALGCATVGFSATATSSAKVQAQPTGDGVVLHSTG